MRRVTLSILSMKKHLTFSGKARSILTIFTSDAEVRGFLQTTNNEYSMEIFKPAFLFINIPVNCQKVKKKPQILLEGGPYMRKYNR